MNRNCDCNKTSCSGNVSRLIHPVFLLIDTSSGMRGRNITEVETFLEEYKAILINANQKNKAIDIEFKISILSFDMIPTIEVSTEDPALVNICFSTGEPPDLRAAFFKLENELHQVRKNGIIQGDDFTFPTLIMIDNHGGSINDANIGLSRLKQNKWFVNGTRIALSLGYGAEMTYLEGFTGGRGSIIKTDGSFPSWGAFFAKLMGGVTINSLHASLTRFDENELCVDAFEYEDAFEIYAKNLSDAFEISANNSAKNLSDAIAALDEEQWLSREYEQDGSWIFC